MRVVAFSSFNVCCMKRSHSYNSCLHSLPFWLKTQTCNLPFFQPLPPALVERWSVFGDCLSLEWYAIDMSIARDRRVPLAPTLYDGTWVQWLLLRWSLVRACPGVCQWAGPPYRGVSIEETKCLVHICCAAPVSGAALANPGRVPSCIALTHHVGERFWKWQPPMGARSWT